MDEQRSNNAERVDSELDRILDTSLARYSAVEPREGLEGRILAKLRAERSRVPERSWWTWGLAAVVAAVFVAVMALALRPGKLSKPPVAEHYQVTEQPPHEPQQQPVREEHADVHKPGHRGRARPVASETRMAAGIPKLSQFPSPQPLTEEERALARYVRDFPQEALLVAQSQAESELEMQKKMGKTEPVSSDEQER